MFRLYVQGSGILGGSGTIVISTIQQQQSQSQSQSQQNDFIFDATKTLVENNDNGSTSYSVVYQPLFILVPGQVEFGDIIDERSVWGADGVLRIDVTEEVETKVQTGEIGTTTNGLFMPER